MQLCTDRWIIWKIPPAPGSLLTLKLRPNFPFEMWDQYPGPQSPAYRQILWLSCLPKNLSLSLLKFFIFSKESPWWKYFKGHSFPNFLVSHKGVKRKEVFLKYLFRQLLKENEAFFFKFSWESLSERLKQIKWGKLAMAWGWNVFVFGNGLE